MSSPLLEDQETISDINIVPFVDILLVVLIIFMVTSPVIVRPSINVNLPKASNGESQGKPSKLQIVIDAQGKTFLNGRSVTMNQLKKQAKTLATESSATHAIISADAVAPHGKVVAIIDAVKSQGINKFSIATSAKPK